MKVICPKCGEPIRYINASRNLNPDGIFVVDPQPRELISERGRIITGYNVHVCKGGEDGKDSDSQDQETTQ